MSHHWKRCPYCRGTVEEGYGLPTKSLGNPERICRLCGHKYIDKDIIDWRKASILKKISFCLANGRFFICFIPYVIVTARIGSSVNWEDWQVYLAGLPIFLIIFALCVIYVKLKVKLFYEDLYPKSTDDISLEERYAKYKDGLFVKRTDENEKKRK